jgi:hypothetical protein
MKNTTTIVLELSEEEFHQAISFIGGLVRKVSAPAATHEEAARILGYFAGSVVKEKQPEMKTVN